MEYPKNIAMSQSSRVLDGRWPSQNIFAIHVESHVPEPDALHQAFRLFQFPVSSEDGVDEFGATIPPHPYGSLGAFLPRYLPHVVFADFEECRESCPQSVSTHEKILEQFGILLGFDAWQALVRPLDFVG